MSIREFLFGFKTSNFMSEAKQPHLFISYDIDRYTCRRTVPTGFLSLGMGRTGTASMKQALEILGYPTSHGFDMHSNLRDGDMWSDAFAAKYFGDTSTILDSNFWDKLLGHVSATTDSPANCFGPELMAAYPEAKIILVEREVEAWYKSFDKAVIDSIEIPPWAKKLLEHFSEKMWKLRSIMPEIMHGQFHSKDTAEWRNKARTVYEEHYAEIHELLKDQPERLWSTNWAPAGNLYATFWVRKFLVLHSRKSMKRLRTMR